MTKINKFIFITFTRTYESGVLKTFEVVITKPGMVVLGIFIGWLIFR